jgi:SlyX protein
VQKNLPFADLFLTPEPLPMSDQRLAELEVKCAYLEKTVADLSDVLWRQQRELDALKDGYRSLNDRIASDVGLVDASRNDRPPHY